MTPPRHPATAAATLTAAALLLTACGSSKDGGSKNADSPPTPAATTTFPTAPTGAATPTFDFPSDIKVTIDPDTTGNTAKDAVLKDQAYAQQAMLLAVAKLDKSLPVFTKYVSDNAASTWINSITWGVKNHRSVTGTDEFYDRKVTLSSPATAEVTFCEDQTNSYDKDTKTGKVYKTTPSIQDFVSHSSLLRKATNGIWQTTSYTTKEGATQCRR